jgi:hypothetical protein
MRGRDLDYQTNREDAAPKCDRNPATNTVRDGSGNECTKKGANGELERSETGLVGLSVGCSYHSNNQAGADIGEIIFSSRLVVLAKTSTEIREGEESRDLASVITKALVVLALASGRYPEHSHEATHRDQKAHIQ